MVLRYLLATHDALLKICVVAHRDRAVPTTFPLGCLTAHEARSPLAGRRTAASLQCWQTCCTCCTCTPPTGACRLDQHNRAVTCTVLEQHRGAPRDGWGVTVTQACSHVLLVCTTTPHRIVIVSNYTQTLDLVSAICRERAYPFLRLDGGTSVGKRQKLVAKFNDPTQNQVPIMTMPDVLASCARVLVSVPERLTMLTSRMDSSGTL